MTIFLLFDCFFFPLDAVYREYAKLKKNTYVLTLFPTAKGEYQKAIDVINRYGRKSLSRYFYSDPSVRVVLLVLI